MLNGIYACHFTYLFNNYKPLSFVSLSKQMREKNRNVEEKETSVFSTRTG